MEFKLMTYLRKRGAALSLLLLFLTYVGGVTLFIHRHTIEGQVVYHSHFYSGSAEQPNHTHTLQQFKTLSAMAIYVAVVAVALCSIVAPFFRGETLLSLGFYHLSRRRVFSFLLRAPPALA